jgi:hypothetical protein
MKIKGESDGGRCFFRAAGGQRRENSFKLRAQIEPFEEGDAADSVGGQRSASTCAVDGLSVFVYGRTVLSRRCHWALALGIFLQGCGPIEYLAQVSSRAASTLAQAKVQGAEKAAPYEYAKAVEYYHKAREDAGHSYFQSAVNWGRRSEDCSRKAIERTKQPHKAGAIVPGEHTTCGNP